MSKEVLEEAAKEAQEDKAPLLALPDEARLCNPEKKNTHTHHTHGQM